MRHTGSTTSPTLLGPLVDKLTRRSRLATDETAALLALPTKPASLQAGRYLVREGDTAEACAVLLSGFVFRSKTVRDGGRQILSFHMKGDLLDLQGSILPEADHSIVALTRIEVAYIPHQPIRALIATHPGIAQALWRDTMVDASIFREWILNVGQRDAHQRISHLLCEIALRQEETGIGGNPHYEWPFTQEHIGDATGLTSVHVNRTLQRMRGEGLISTGKQSLTIADWEGLRAAGDFQSGYLHQGSLLAA